MEHEEIDTELQAIALDEPAAVPPALFTGAAMEMSPRVSPDGRRLAWIADDSGEPEVYVGELTGGAPRRLTRFDGPIIFHLRWSPDGRRLACHVSEDERLTAHLIDAESGETRELLRHDGYFGEMVWGEDGRSLLLNRLRDGFWEFCRVDAASGICTVLTERPLLPIGETAAGLLHWRAMESGPCLLEADGSSRPLPGLEHLTAPLAFARAGERYHLSYPSEPGISLLSLAPAVARIDSVARVEARGFRDFGVSPDGATLYLSRVLNWESELLVYEDLF